MVVCLLVFQLLPNCCWHGDGDGDGDVDVDGDGVATPPEYYSRLMRSGYLMLNRRGYVHKIAAIFPLIINSGMVRILIAH